MVKKVESKSHTKFWQILLPRLSKNARMVTKLSQNLKHNRRRIIYDNEHCCINLGFSERSQISDFFWNISKKNQFSIKKHPLEMTPQIKPDDKFFWCCQLKIPNIKLVFQKFFWYIANQNPFLRLLKWLIFALFQHFLNIQETPAKKIRKEVKKFLAQITSLRNV